MIIKVVEIDGIEKHRARKEENLKVIEFESQIEHADE